MDVNLQTALAVDLHDARVYELKSCVMHTKYFQDAGLAWSYKRRKVAGHIPSVAPKPQLSSPPHNSLAIDADMNIDDEAAALAALGLPTSFIAGKPKQEAPSESYPTTVDQSSHGNTTNTNGTEQPMLPRWQQAFDPSTQHYYYYCEATQETQWEPPIDEEFVPIPAGWTVELSNNTVIEHVTPRKDDLQQQAAQQPSPLPRQRSPYDLAVESYKQYHGWYGSEIRSNSVGDDATEYRATGQYIEDDIPLAHGKNDNVVGDDDMNDASSTPASSKEEGKLKPRMETTGLMPEIPEPHGTHLRFDSSSDEEGNLNKQRQQEKSCVDASLADLASDMQDLTVIEHSTPADADGDDVTSHQQTPPGSIHKGSSSTGRKQKKKTRRGRRSGANRPENLPANLEKYWMQRYSLFSRYDEGIVMDEGAWYSVTPEIIAWHQAKRIQAALGPDCVVIDAFAGVGGNAIQLALTCKRVIAVEIDEHRVDALTHNAAIYEVEDKIDIVQGDFFKVAETVKADVAFFSPPWGGPQYSTANETDPEGMNDGGVYFKLSKLLHLAFQTMGCKAVIAWLPRNTNLNQLQALLPRDQKFCEVERAVLNGIFKGISVYFGAVAKDMGVTKFK